MKEHIETITDLLLGAAYADKRLEGSEVQSIEILLCKVLDADEVPEELKARMRTFNPAKLDLAAAGAALAGLSDDEKREIVQLIDSVSESDEVIDFDEDAYVGRVGVALGLSSDDVRRLHLEILEEGDAEEGDGE